MIHRPRKFLPFVLGQHTACRHIIFLILLALIVIGPPVLSGAQQTCQPDGDVNQDGGVTATDALLAFQQALGLAVLSECQQGIADVFPQPAAPDGNITASDAFCILQRAFDSPSCLDILPLPNEPPLAYAGPDQIVAESTGVRLSGSGSDSDGTIVSHAWEQTGGTMVSITGASSATAMFTAPEVSMDETLTFQLTVMDDDGATGSDDVNVTVGIGIKGFTSVSAGYHPPAGCVKRVPWHAGVQMAMGDRRRLRAPSPRSAPGGLRPAGCLRQAPWPVGVMTNSILVSQF